MVDPGFLVYKQPFFFRPWFFGQSLKMGSSTSVVRSTQATGSASALFCFYSAGSWALGVLFFPQPSHGSKESPIGTAKELLFWTCPR